MMLERELTGKTLADTIRTLAEDPGLIRRTGALAFSLAKLDAATRGHAVVLFYLAIKMRLIMLYYLHGKTTKN